MKRMYNGACRPNGKKPWKPSDLKKEELLVERTDHGLRRRDDNAMADTVAQGIHCLHEVWKGEHSVVA